MSETPEKNLPAAQAPVPPKPSVPPSTYFSANNFDTAQRMANAFANSNLVPDNYKGNTANALIAIELGARMGASPFMVAQNLNIIHGRPSWSSSFIIATINSCGRFKKPLRWKTTGEGDEKTCIAYAVDAETGEVIEGPPVSIKMAKEEGWFNRSGSKWKTMPIQMLQYRAASFFGRLYVSDILMGMQSVEEREDIIDVTPGQDAEAPKAAVSAMNERINSRREPEKSEAAKAAPAVPTEEYHF